MLIGGSLAMTVGAKAATSKPVVLELFTSQGCSSCPPADALLGQLSRRAGVIALAWHVDYWNNLGWRDRFASGTATKRQRAYATQLGAGIFTPALVVNGTQVLIGSDRDAIETAIAAAAGLPVAIALSRGPDVAEINIAPAPGQVRVQSIVYEPEHATDVDAGENEGARLREYRIVRSVETLAEWDGTARVLTARLPEAGQGLSVLLQSGDLRVLGAADLPPA
ncbi:MAG TPA: DUF1223 domain-containing protein [Acetobacteraceae bacterium]